MNDLHGIKVVPVVPPAAIVNNASFTTAEVDTLGYRYATIIVNIGATDIAMTALKVQESSTSGSGFTDVSGATFDGGTDIERNTTTLPSATSDGKCYLLQLELNGRKRYLDLVATAGNGSAGTYLSATCILTKAEHAPTTVAGANAGGIIQV